MSKRHLLRRLAVVLVVATTFVGFGATDANAAGQTGANNFNNAPLLPPGPSVNTGNTAYATIQAGEPDHDAQDPGATVWWRYRRGTTRTVRLSLAGSNFDTILAVYRGSQIAHLTEIESNDDASSPPDVLWSRLTFEAQANVTYRIVVGGYGATDPIDHDERRGAYKLTVTPL